MKIGNEYINSKHVTYVGWLVENENYNDPSMKYMFTIKCLDGNRYEFWFGTKEFGNRARNALIDEIEKA